jgi:hypothetical protein
MALQTQRFKPTERAPHSLEVQTYLLGASTLLLHLELLPGVRVVSKRSWALTDDFEAYFIYKGRLWVMETPFAKIEVSLLGQPPNEGLFQEIEARVKGYSPLFVFLLPIAFVRYVATRFIPTRETFREFAVPIPGQVPQDAL